MESCQSYCLGRCHLLSLAFDALLFSIFAWLHSLVVMSIAMVWYVSMESDQAILAFMIVSNFGEIKTTVFKRFDSEKLFVLCRMDVVERLNLLLAAAFIVVEDWGQIGDWTINSEILYKCASILVLESIVDVVKHSVVVNFNGIPPGIYRTYLRDRFQKLLEDHGESTVDALVFEPIGPAILFLRVISSALFIGNRPRVLQWCMAMGVFVVLLIWKLIMGWSLQLGAEWYLQYSKSYERKQL